MFEFAAPSQDHAPPMTGVWDRQRTSRPMTFGRSIRTCLVKFATFSGRASRPEYWWFALFVFLAQFAAGLLDAALFGPDVSALGLIVGLGTFVPSLAAGWRRMHDSGRTGLHLIYPFIVMIGIGTFGAFAIGIPEGTVQDASMIVLVFAGIVFMISPLLVLWWLTRPSDPRPNRYGPPPPEVTR